MRQRKASLRLHGWSWGSPCRDLVSSLSEEAVSTFLEHCEPEIWVDRKGRLRLRIDADADTSENGIFNLTQLLWAELAYWADELDSDEPEPDVVAALRKLVAAFEKARRKANVALPQPQNKVTPAVRKCCLDAAVWLEQQRPGESQIFRALTRAAIDARKRKAAIERLYWEARDYVVTALGGAAAMAEWHNAADRSAEDIVDALIALAVGDFL